MPRTTITAVAAPGPYPTAGTTMTFTAADVANGNQTHFSGRVLLIARNDDASPQTVTITSVSDPFGRTGSISAESLLAGATKMYGPFSNPVGWQSSDGFLYFAGGHANIKFCPIDLGVTR